MTGMLASVRNLAEARMVLDAGADILDLKEPALGALGAVPAVEAAGIVAAVGGRTLVSATVGDLAFERQALVPAIERMAATGVDLVKVGIFTSAPDPGALEALAGFARAGIRLVAVIFAEHYRGPVVVDQLARAGMYGVMLDTADKGSGSLTGVLDISALGEFLATAAELELITGLAGSLTLADVPILAALKPRYLGFRGALCGRGRREGELDPVAIRAIRNCIDRADSEPVPGMKLTGGRRELPA